MEMCIGCGAEAERHPMVGIGRANQDDNTGELVEHPVCDPCWKHPAHRTRALKVAYEFRARGAVALATAKVLDDKSKRGEDLQIG